jgi:putative tryptophan/tyrosine transport system substrate-binding protein
MKLRIVTGIGVILCLVAAAFLTEGLAAEKQVALIWEGKASQAKRVAASFLSEMTAIAPQVTITSRIALPDMEEAERVFRALEATSDGIVFLRSNGAQFLAKAKSSKPCFIGGCNHPSALGVVANLERPEGNITGVTNFVPFEMRFELIKEIFPGIKSLALLLDKRHPATPIEAAGTAAQCKKLGIAYQEVAAEDQGDLVRKTAQLAGKVDLFIAGNMALVIDNTTKLLGILNPARTPLFSYSEKPVESGAVAGVVARDDYLGRKLAESVVDVIVRGKPVSQVPIKMDPKPKLYVHEGMKQFLGLKLSDSLLKTAEVLK